MPWKWIVCGWEPPLLKRTRRRSSSVARITGPGTLPLYVHAAKVTPWATSTSRSSATSSYSRTRPGSCGSAAGGSSNASSSPGRPGAGTVAPTIAAWPSAGRSCARCDARCSASFVSPRAILANGPAAISGAPAASSRRRVTARLANAASDLDAIRKLLGDGMSLSGDLDGDRPAVRRAVDDDDLGVGRKAERGVDLRLEAVREMMLEPLGLLVDLVPAEAQRLGEVELEQAVMANDLESDPLARGGQRRTAIRLVCHEPQAGELLEHSRRGRRRDVELGGERRRGDPPTPLELPDRL